MAKTIDFVWAHCVRPHKIAESQLVLGKIGIGVAWAIQSAQEINKTNEPELREPELREPELCKLGAKPQTLCAKNQTFS